jgi:predicted adenine nucleotide alpha hydrolase (AANH) superfamily ATPase
VRKRKKNIKQCYTSGHEEHKQNKALEFVEEFHGLESDVCSPKCRMFGSSRSSLYIEEICICIYSVEKSRLGE